jgi:S-(hydroxymethyl)glutathione dehydrogenase/alcohol dehydrogenase
MRRGRAVVTTEGGGIALVDVEVDEPGEGEVLVDLHASGVCHTDHDLRRWPGLVLGHEGAGVVGAVGPGVTGVETGERVVLNWAMPCGSCFQCVAGNRHFCEIGSPSSAVRARTPASRARCTRGGRCAGPSVSGR